MFPFLELSEDVRQQIVTYLGVWEFLPLTLTSQRARQDVEDFSKGELDRIAREHAIDDSWWDRVGLDVEGENITALFSFRRSLRNAYRRHLYSLEQGTTVADLVLSMHPDGKHMLSACYGSPPGEELTSFCVWDLSTKQCIRRFNDNGGNRGVYKAGFSAGHIVILSSYTEELSIWSMDGERKHHFDRNDLGDDVDDVATANDLVYASHEESSSISVINPTAGTVRSMEQLWQDDGTDIPGYGVKLCVYNNYLVILRACVGTPAETPPGAGVYIVDIDSWTVESFRAGVYKSMAVTSDGDFALKLSDHEIQLFQLRDGHLDFRCSIRFPESPRCLRWILHGTNSRFFVCEEHPGTDVPVASIAVYNALNGTMERRLCHPRACASAVVSNEKEVFVAFSFALESGLLGWVIKAFLL